MSLYGLFTASFFFILIFLIQLIAYKCFLKKYADDWIQTADLLCQKQLLCQLSYNLFLLIFFTCMAICLVSVSRYSEVPSSGLLIGKTICSALYLSSFLLLWICSFSPFSMKSVSLKYKNDLGGVQIFWKMKKSFKFLKNEKIIQIFERQACSHSRFPCSHSRFPCSHSRFPCSILIASHSVLYKARSKWPLANKCSNRVVDSRLGNVV